MDTAGNSVRFPQSQSVAGFAIPGSTPRSRSRGRSTRARPARSALDRLPAVRRGSTSRRVRTAARRRRRISRCRAAALVARLRRRRVRRLRLRQRQRQLGLLHQRRRRPPRAIEHRAGQRGHPDPLGHLRRPWAALAGHHLGVGHHRGQRAGDRRTRQPDQRRCRSTPQAPRSRSPGSTPPASAPRAASASPSGPPQGALRPPRQPARWTALARASGYGPGWEYRGQRLDAGDQPGAGVDHDPVLADRPHRHAGQRGRDHAGPADGARQVVPARRDDDHGSGLARGSPPSWSGPTARRLRGRHRQAPAAVDQVGHPVEARGERRGLSHSTTATRGRLRPDTTTATRSSRVRSSPD